MKKLNQQLKRKSLAFQSDIVITPDGEVRISFLGEDLLDLTSIKNITPNKQHQHWSLNPPQLDFKSSDYKNCKLCPLQCGFNREKNEHILCGDWKLRVSNLGISYGDEACISQDRGSGIIFLSGCPLTCPSCINPEKVHSPGAEISLKDFLQLFEKLYKKGVNNIQILSPTVHLPNLKLALKILKKQNFPLPIIFKSSGYDQVKQVASLEGLFDIYLPDLKPCLSKKWLSCARVKNDYLEQFITSLKEMHRQVGKARYQNGILTKGVLIRYVPPSYLSELEKDQMMEVLNQFSNYAELSVLDNFTNLE